MPFRDFCSVLLQGLEEELPENVRLRTRGESGGPQNTVLLLLSPSPEEPAEFALLPYYREFRQGVPMPALIHWIASDYEKRCLEAPYLPVLENAEDILPHVCIRLMPCPASCLGLAARPFADLTLLAELPSPFPCRRGYFLRRDELRRVRISEEELFAAGLANARKRSPAVLLDLNSALRAENAPCGGFPDRLPLYMLTGEARYGGATAAAYPESDILLSAWRHPLYLIAGSQHEWLVLPSGGNGAERKARRLLDGIMESGRNLPDFLSDRLYLYTPGGGFRAV